MNNINNIDVDNYNFLNSGIALFITTALTMIVIVIETAIIIIILIIIWRIPR